MGEAAMNVQRRQEELAAMRARDAEREEAQHRREVRQARAALARFWPGDVPRPPAPAQQPE
eukprot:11908749-Alexandrium_andersonii.AAC.1